MDRGKVEVRPITAESSEAVCRFLHEHLNPRVPLAAWKAILDPPWHAEAPNHGFQLVVDATIVGAYVAVYSHRVVDGVERGFCNLAAFCVQEGYRSHSVRLMRAILGQREFEFTDLSPSGNVVALNERLGFVALDTATRVVANLPSIHRRGLTVTDSPSVAARVLRGRDAEVYRDHQDAPAARHIVVVKGGEYGYLVIRKDRRKGLRVFASPLYVGGDADLLRTAWPQVASHLLLRHGALATLAERRIIGSVPAPGYALRSPRAKMLRSRNVSGDTIDYLYSELTLLEW